MKPWAVGLVIAAVLGWAGSPWAGPRGFDSVRTARLAAGTPGHDGLTPSLQSIDGVAINDGFHLTVAPGSDLVIQGRNLTAQPGRVTLVDLGHPANCEIGGRRLALMVSSWSDSSVTAHIPVVAGMTARMNRSAPTCWLNFELDTAGSPPLTLGNVEIELQVGAP